MGINPIILAGLLFSIFGLEGALAGIFKLSPIMTLLLMAVTLVIFFRVVGKKEEPPESLGRREVAEALLTEVPLWLSANDDGSIRVNWRKNAALLSWMMENYLNEKETKKLQEIVHETICDIGGKSFRRHLKDQEHNHPDYTKWLALGYVIRHKVLTDREISLIRFDHGETAEEYAAQAEGLLEKVMGQLKKGTAYVGSSPPRMASPFSMSDYT